MGERSIRGEGNMYKVMKTSDNYIIMIRMLKVLWYYKRLKVNKYADSGHRKKQQQHSQ